PAVGIGLVTLSAVLSEEFLADQHRLWISFLRVPAIPGSLRHPRKFCIVETLGGGRWFGFVSSDCIMCRNNTRGDKCDYRKPHRLFYLLVHCLAKSRLTLSPNPSNSYDNPQRKSN